MNTLVKTCFACLLLVATAAAEPSDANPRVIFETQFGSFEVELFADKAPITVQNFLQYVKQERYQDAHFYRVVTADNQPDSAVKIAVVQGGLGWDPHHDRQPPIIHETTKQTGIVHENGTLSMARLDPGTADAEFFFCIGAQPELDFGGRRHPDGQGFAAFGKVTQGMQVLKKIHTLENVEQLLTEKVPMTIRIKKATPKP